MSNSTCLPTHLDSPLNDKILLEAIHHVKDGQKQFRNRAVESKTEELRELIFQSGIILENVRHDSQLAILSMSQLIQSRRLNIFNSNKTLEKQLLCTESLTSLSLPMLDDLNLSRRSVESKFRSIYTHPFYTLLCHYHHVREFLEQGVCLSAKPKKVPRQQDLEIWENWEQNSEDLIFKGKLGNEILIWISSSYCVIKIKDSIPFLTTRDHFLMLSDIISQRFSCLLTSILAQLFKNDRYPTPLLLLQVFRWGDDLLQQVGNKAYKKLCLWEALCVGTLLKSKDDPLVDNYEFYNKIKNEFLEAEQGINRSLLQLKMIQLENMMEKLNKTPHIITQIFGLYRIWGHPTIDGVDGIRKLKKIACKRRMINHSTVHTIHCKFREYFSLNYYKKHHKWPNFQFNRPPSSYLDQCLQDGIEIDIKHKDYRLMHWSNINYEKTFNIPEKFELSEMIADKATSHSIPSLIYFTSKHGTIGPGYTRSVILQFLRTNYNDPQQFLEEICNNGFGEEEKILGVHPKEREEKNEPRLFGMLPIKKRLYVVLTEALLADNLFPYFPEITMTFDSNTLMKKIYYNTNILSPNKTKQYSKSIIVNLDFNKWNSYMREEETYGMFADFDSLFGLTDCYTRSHSMFTDAQLYLADGTYTPKWDSKTKKFVEDEGCWSHHLGGIEGLRQKGWTIFTVVILKYIAQKEGIKCSIMGQGDNQVLICQYFNLDEAQTKNAHKIFLHSLNSFLRQIGPPLKMEETWSSSKFFIYGKYPVLEGVPLCMSLKKICRTMRLTNDGLQNLETTLSSITANAAAATMSEVSPIIPYIIGMFESVGAVILHVRHPFYGKSMLNFGRTVQIRLPYNGTSVKHSVVIPLWLKRELSHMDNKLIVKILLAPCCLGGFPCLQLTDLLLHGFPDPVSFSLWMLKQIYKETRSHEGWIREWLCKLFSPPINPNVSPEMLASDPVSLNLLRPSSGSDKIKNMVFQFLTTEMDVQNKIFLEFLNIAKDSQKEISELLFKMTPLNPRIMNSVLESTIVGRANKVVAKVNKTTTMVGLMLRSKEKKIETIRELEDGDEISSKGQAEFYRIYYSFELNYFSSLIYNMSSNVDIIDITEICSTVQAQKLREDSWGTQITGVTTAVPFEFINWVPVNESSCRDHPESTSPDGYFLLRNLVNKEKYEDFKTPLGIGPVTPYLGSRTKKKIVYEGGELKKVAPPLMKNVCELLSLIGWGVHQQSNFGQLIQLIFNSFTDLPIDYCLASAGDISGSLEHRWQDEATSHESSISISYELATWMVCVTNNFRPEKRLIDSGTDNFNISYQSVFASIAMLWSHKLINRELFPYNPSYHGHLLCEKCVLPIYEGDLEIPRFQDNAHILQQLEPHPLNPYCWISQDKLLNSRIKSLLTRVNLGDEVDTPNNVRNQVPLFVCSWVLLNSSVTPNLEDYSGAAEMNNMIPINLAKVVDVPTLINWTILFRLVAYLFINCISKSKSHYFNKMTWFMEAKESLKSTPIEWFTPWSSIFIQDKALIQLGILCPEVVPPVGTPPGLISRCVFLKNIFISLLDTQVTIPWFLSMVEKYLSMRIFSSLIYFNPILLKILLKTFNLATAYDNKDSLFALSVVRKTVLLSQHSEILNSNYNLLPIILDYKAEIRDAQGYNTSIIADSLIFVADVVDEIRTTCLKVNVDGLLKFYKGVVDEILPCIEVEESIKDQVINLPKSCCVLSICKNYKDEHLGYYLFPELVFEPQERSIRNHFYRSEGLLTTGPYKILSVIKYLIDKEIIIRDPLVIAAVGDGVGGYGSTLSRIFPESTILYNTYYEAERMMSHGVENYIPASYLRSKIPLDRVDGIKDTEQGLSDLTDPNFTKSWCKTYRNIDLIVSDAEGSVWFSDSSCFGLIHTLISLCEERECDLLILKTYVRQLDRFLASISLLNLYFSTVTILRSYFSSIGGTEVYIVCNQLKLSPHPFSYERTENGLNILSPSVNISLIQDIKRKIVGNRDFYGDCSLFYQAYNETVQPKFLSEAHNKQIEAHLRQYTKFSEIIIPSDIIYKFRTMYLFPEISESKGSILRPSKLTFKHVQDIAMEYLRILGLLISNKEDIQRFEDLIEKGWIYFYQSLDDSWACHISFEVPTLYFYKIRRFKLSNLFPEHSRKHLLRTVGSINYRAAKFIRVKGTEFDNLSPQFATLKEDWYASKDKNYIPLSLCPLIKNRDGTKRTITLSLPERKKKTQENESDLSSVSTWIEIVEEDIKVQDLEWKRPFVSHKLKIKLSRNHLTVKNLMYRWDQELLRYDNN